MDNNLINILTRLHKEKFPSKPFVPGESFVPVSGKSFNEKEVVNMVEAVLDGWWTEGRFARLFESRMSKWLGVKYTAIVNSGSSANLVAFSALTSMKLGEKRLKPGDEVISVAAGFPTTVNPIIQHGLVPVFVDVDMETYNANIEQIQRAITPKTKAIFLAHTLGNPYDLEAIASLCEKYDLWFIEDNCDGLGSVYNGKKTGTFGHVATCSFYPAHHITMGEGGAVFTNDSKLYLIIKSIRDWGRDCWCPTGKDNTCGKRFDWKLGELPYGYDHKYTYSELGYNLKVTDMQAALGLAQLEKVDGFVQKRKENFKYLYDNLKKFEDRIKLPKWSEKADPSWFGFLISVKDSAGFGREEIIAFLNKRRIGTRLLFAGNLTKQPYFIDRNISYRIAASLENTDRIMHNTFWIGVYPGLTEEMLEYVVKSFEDFFMQKFQQ